MDAERYRGSNQHFLQVCSSLDTKSAMSRVIVLQKKWTQQEYNLRQQKISHNKNKEAQLWDNLDTMRNLFPTREELAPYKKFHPRNN
jgi:hypothetical protein